MNFLSVGLREYVLLSDALSMCSDVPNTEMILFQNDNTFPIRHSRRTVLVIVNLDRHVFCYRAVAPNTLRIRSVVVLTARCRVHSHLINIAGRSAARYGGPSRWLFVVGKHSPR